MLAFATEHAIIADVELLPSAHVEQARIRLERGDVRYRLVLDLSDLDQPAPEESECSGIRRGAIRLD
jgi:uncharacterized zinc-type alcohol dehydrogenase-like protein